MKIPPGLAKGEHRILLSDADTVNRKLDTALHEIDAVTAQTREAVLSGQPREPEDE